MYAGCGGWDLAARSLGMHGVGIELADAACATREAAGLPTLHGSVLDYGFTALPSVGLIASPPCQEFSTAGDKLSVKFKDEIVARLRDMNTLDTSSWPIGARLVVEPLRWVEEAWVADQPYSWLALEQVAPVLPIWEAMRPQLEEMGYVVWSGVLNSEEYGVPQTRKRAVLVASLGSVTAPAPTHAARGGSAPRAPERILDALHVGNYTGCKPAGRSSPGAPRALADQSFTVTAAGNLTWVRLEDYEGVPSARASSAEIRAALPENQEYRVATVEELAALQSFPVGLPWRGTQGEVKRQIGNAVPPKLARAVLHAATANLR